MLRVSAIRVGLLMGSLALTGISTAAESSKEDRPWALEPLHPPTVPEVKQKGWVRNPIDAFILAKLESKGLAPSQSAERATLLRRVSFDLTGLPPAPREIQAFIHDKSPHAFANVVDRLLASPHYGERWGRHWLDLVRFCESHGFEYDKIRDHAWRYRDYVIASFNQDKLYSRFIREQIAGDMLEPQTRDGIVATGFLVCAPWDEAGNNQVSTVMKARIREEELEDMVAVVGQTFLGLTVNCARCHDHKFDPIPQKDYYAVKAALAGARPGNRSILTSAEARQRTEQQQLVSDRLKALDAASKALEDTARQRITQASGGASGSVTTNKAWPEIAPPPMARWTFDKDCRDSVGHLDGELKSGAVMTNGRLRLDGKASFAETVPLRESLREKTLEVWATLGSLEQGGGAIMSLELNGNGEIFDGIVFGERDKRQWMAGSEFYRRTQKVNGPEETASPGELVHLALVCSADSSVRLYRNGLPYGNPYTPTGEKSALQTFPAGSTRVLFGLRHHGAGNGFFQGEIEEARLYDRALNSEQVASSFHHGPTVVTPELVLAALTPAEHEQYEINKRERLDLQANLRALTNVPLAYAATPKAPDPTFVLRRGDVDKPGELVRPGALSCVGDLPGNFALGDGAPEGQGRLKLAEWITDRQNPLTPRVLVNRVWHYHFGRGLSATPNDFGANGDDPSHPELLDWLASEFLKGGGSIKALHRLILLSSTYQQGGGDAHSPEQQQAAKLDADDRLLWRFPIQRLEGEEVRDAMLALTGDIDDHMGGPGFRPFSIFINNSHFYNLQDRAEPEYNRRTVYRINVQSARDPLLDSLDCPDPSTKTPIRARTTTPIQSLGLMNSSFVQRQARNLSTRLQRQAGDKAQDQIRLAWQLAYAREPRLDELERLTRFVAEQGLESLCWVVFNSSEFLYFR